MPTREQVWKAADEVHRTGERVSQERVLAVLRRRFRGGTERTVGPLLLGWVAERNYDAKLEAAAFPACLRNAHVAFVEKVWAEALVAASLQFEARAGKAEAVRRAAAEFVDEANAATERAEREAAAAAARAEVLEREVAALREDAARTGRAHEALADENARMRKRLDHVRAEEFWDRVMLEVRDLLPVGGSRPMEDVLADMRQSTHRGARLHKERLDGKTLRKKMRERFKHRKYFEEGPDGTLVRKAG